MEKQKRMLNRAINILVVTEESPVKCVMAQLRNTKKAGLIEGEKTAEFCQKCHNEESPSFKEFKFEEMWAKIEHKLPPKKKK